MPKAIIGLYAFHSPACVDYDPRSAEVARRVAERITARLPRVTVEHIGSTAVPDCAGKGIVDLMVVYPDGQLERVKETLARLGFQRQTVGFLHPETRPMRVGTLEHQGRVFPMHVHVLASSSPEVAQLRAFRDRLCADPKLVAAYVARKKEIIAAGVTDPAAYTRMKSLFFQHVQDPSTTAAPGCDARSGQAAGRLRPVPAGPSHAG
jgi:GrpB-like predicted nucleotidyltransferase (UPF0157 family)